MSATNDPETELVRDMPSEVVEVKEPPVVARLVVEIRSDGTSTIARGALEDLTTGQRAMIDAHGTTPMQLAFALMKSITQLPKLSAKMAIRGLLSRKK
ncbi:MAG TPA: hypothetical protein VGC41_24920 [Kofleriaceae bacterium]